MESQKVLVRLFPSKKMGNSFIQDRCHQYEVHIGNDLLKNKIGKNFRKFSPSQRAILFADKKVLANAKILKKQLESEGWTVGLSSLAVSEDLKDLKHLDALYQVLFDFKADRNSLILAMGGGVIGDAIGFLAATYMRGIPWISIPTTLLAQVDSGIGGKTGVNHRLGKNLIGAFHQPSQVVCDVNFLNSLNQRDLVSGLGEMIKYGILFNSRFFKFLQSSWCKVVYDKDPSSLVQAVTQCAKWKIQLVEEDEFDRLGKREILNFGHTLGHGLEAITSYRHFRHGEAVILGMRAASRISWKKGALTLREYQEIENFLSSLPIPTYPKRIDRKLLLSLIQQDKKKASSGRVRFVLIRGIGKPYSDSNVLDQEIFEAVDYLVAH